MYSTVDECPSERSQSWASPYFCSGLSPVTKSASVQRNFLPALAIASTSCGPIIDRSGSPGSFLKVQYEQVSRHRLTKLMNTLREYVTTAPGLVLSLILPAADTSTSVAHSAISCRVCARDNALDSSALFNI